jgi:hypothetical protein
MPLGAELVRSNYFKNKAIKELLRMLSALEELRLATHLR